MQPARILLHALLFASLTLPSALLGGTPAPPNARLSGEQQLWLAHASRQDRHGWIQLKLQGSPPARGFQHGYLLASEFIASREARRQFWERDTAMPWSWLVQETSRFLTPRIGPEWTQELDGITAGLAARGVSTTRDELVALNAYFELAWYWWPLQKDRLKSLAPHTPRESCSAFIATGSMTSDGSIVMGHNTMFDYAIADFNVILDITPQRGHRLILQTAPGLIHSGTDFFLTGAGLIGCETTIGDFEGFNEDGAPEFVRMRQATQYANTIDDWCRIMQTDNNGGYANAWLLGDVRSGEIARLELGLRHVALHRTLDGYFTGSNVAEDRKLLIFETSRRDTDIRLSSVARRVRWQELMHSHRGRIDVKRARRFEADHYDAYLRKTAPGARSLCGHFEENDGRLGPGQPFDPSGTFDAKVIDSTMARSLTFSARWGRACGQPFDAKAFLRRHPQFGWQEGILKSRPSQPWTALSPLR